MNVNSETSQKNESTEEISFENRLEELEDVVARLEQGDLPLEKALELYEKGVSAYRDCHKQLETAQSKVVELVETLEGELEEEEFDVPEEQQ